MGAPDVPVFVGAERPMQRDPVHAFEVHGEHGLGQAQLPDPGLMPQGSAVKFIINSIHSRPGGVTVVATGPLTNLAMAETESPGILSQARRILIMGGAIDQPGNVTPVSEFNFYADPHAARQVLCSGANLTVIPLDITQQVQLEQDLVEAQATKKKDAVSAFCVAACHERARRPQENHRRWFGGR